MDFYKKNPKIIDMKLSTMERKDTSSRIRTLAFGKSGTLGTMKIFDS